MAHVWMLALIGTAWAAEGRAKKQAAIDAYCREVRQQFKEMAPYYFEGPDPWVPLEELPSDFLDSAMATVYMDGTKVEWVVLDIQEIDSTGSKPEWFETVHYYFDEGGKVAKRERHFEHLAANTVVEESRYYDKGKLWKARLVHHPLAKGKEDWSQLFDPQAPEYLNTGDLPFPAVVTRQRLARINGIRMWALPASAWKLETAYSQLNEDKLLER